MPPTSRKLRPSHADAGRLDAYLAARLEIPPARAAELIAGGAVYVDGQRERDAARRVAGGEHVTVYTTSFGGAGPLGGPPLRVVHEDPEVLVVDKPVGLPTIPAREGGPSLSDLVAARRPGMHALGRLDRDASGLVLFVGPRATARLDAALRAGLVEREYHALVAGVTPLALIFTAPIGPDPADHRRRRAGVADGEAALTRAWFVGGFHDRVGPYSLLRVLIETGRRHQIRVHLAGGGYPLLGDPLYAPPVDRARAPRLALHATRLAWPGGSATSPLPEELARLVA